MNKLTIVYNLPDNYDVSKLTTDEYISRMSWLDDDGCRTYGVGTLIDVIIATLGTVIFLFLVLTTSAEANEYMVAGSNLITGDRVYGQMYDIDENGTVSGEIRDNTMKVRVVGQWSGIGKAILVSEEPAMAYGVEVVE